MKYRTLGIPLLLALLVTHRSSGAVIITARETGPDVVFSGSGSINLADLEFRTMLVQPAFIDPGHDAPVLTMAAGEYTYYHGGGGIPHSITKPPPFGPVEGSILADSYSGNLLSMNTGSTGAVPRHAILGVASDYNSGDPLSLQMTFAGETIESLQLTPGTYVWTWGAGGNADSVTLNIVPEPSATMSVIALGSLGMACWLRRRKLRR